MARKSRKQPVAVSPGNNNTACQEQTGEGKLPTAIYARLSCESKSGEPEDSIETQVELVSGYIQSNPELQHVETYIDYGFTGTNFDRPAFQRLMDDVRSGKIRCIVVKDLSRFGRDYVETGYYLETVFPYLKVRFIAVNDQFDNLRKEDMESITVPVKNMINSIYAKDVSKKVRAIFDMKQKRGDKPTGKEPYGYVYDREQKSLQVDEEAAACIRVIFQWRMMGVPCLQIAKRLNFLRVLTPKMNQKRLDHEEPEESAEWGRGSVEFILSNPVYTGDLVLGKTQKELYRGVEDHRTDKEEWIIHPDRHEAIILQEDFNEVQNRFSESGENGGKSTANVFAGKVFCGCCGEPMYRTMCTHRGGKEKFGIYACRTLKTNSTLGCHWINENLLKTIVMDQLKVIVRAACDKKEIIQRMMDEKERNSKVTSLKTKVMSVSYRKEQMEERNEKLYRDHADGLIEDEDYQRMKEQYILQIQQLKKELEETSESLLILEKKAGIAEEHIQHLEQYLETQGFNESLVRELVDRIYVGKDHTLRITFQCDDIFQDFLDYAGGINCDE